MGQMGHLGVSNDTVLVKTIQNGSKYTLLYTFVYRVYSKVYNQVPDIIRVCIVCISTVHLDSLTLSVGYSVFCPKIPCCTIWNIYIGINIHFLKHTFLDPLFLGRGG